MEVIVKFNKTESGQANALLYSTNIEIGMEMHYINLEGCITEICKDNDGYFESGWIGSLIGKASTKANWIKDGDIVHINYEKDLINKIESKRLEFENRTGMSLGAWVRDLEDGYKDRYKGQISDYGLLGNRLQIYYQNIGYGFGIDSPTFVWGYEEGIVPLYAGEIPERQYNHDKQFVPKYGNISTFKIKCPCCNDFK